MPEGIVYKELSLREGLKIGSQLANIGALLGVISGGLMLKESATDIASLNGSLYLALGLLLPVAFSAVLHFTKQKGSIITGRLSKKVSVLLVIALTSWALGTILYMVAASIIPGVFGEEDMGTRIRAIRGAILWEKNLIVGSFSVTGILSLGLLYR